MASALTLLLGVASAGFWIAILGVLRTARKRSQAEGYELGPEDGCGCVEVWEYLSERRSGSRRDR